MNKFNTLYNKIITQARVDQFEPRLKKFKVKYPNFDVDKTLKDLLALPSKESKLACTLIVNELITGVDDKKFEMYKDDILNSNVDVSNAQQILNHINQRGTKNYNNQIKSIYNDLEKRFDCLYNKQLLPNKIVIYTIRDNRAAMRQIRQLVDAFHPSDKSTWCLIRRQNNGDMDQGWSNWIKYNAYPKQIAFQDGQLLGFSANRTEQTQWWDLGDLTLKHGLVDKYGKVVRGIKESKPYSSSERTKLTLKQLQELERDDDGRYRTNGELTITNDLLVNGHLPFKYSYVGRQMVCNCQDLISFEGFPPVIGWYLNINDCINLTSLEGAPVKVGKDISYRDVYGIPPKQLKQWVNNTQYKT